MNTKPQESTMDDETGDLLRKLVPIQDPDHVRLLGRVMGLAESLQAIEDVEQEMPRTPGIRVAVATARAKYEELRAVLGIKSFRLGARGGVDVANWTITGYTPKNEIVFEPSGSDAATEQP